MKNDTLEVPEPYRSLIDKVCDRDRDWFLAHPLVNVYERPHVPGEFWPKESEIGPVAFVQVRQVAPGIRIRNPVQEPNPRITRCGESLVDCRGTGLRGKR